MNCNILLITQLKYLKWYSLEASHRDTSNEYPQHMFSLKNEKNVSAEITHITGFDLLFPATLPEKWRLLFTSAVYIQVHFRHDFRSAVKQTNKQTNKQT